MGDKGAETLRETSAGSFTTVTDWSIPSTIPFYSIMGEAAGLKILTGTLEPGFARTIACLATKLFMGLSIMSPSST